MGKALLACKSVGLFTPHYVIGGYVVNTSANRSLSTINRLFNKTSDICSIFQGRLLCLHCVDIHKHYFFSVKGNVVSAILIGLLKVMSR